VDKVVKLVGGKATVRFENIPYGAYALAVLHDVDGDGKMKHNPIGAPLEPVGFSSGATVGMFGPPDFAKAKFNVAAPVVQQVVTLR
jgi:uncharacterized protein (DUF2141 family)